jgi:hypothetical protein
MSGVSNRCGKVGNTRVGHSGTDDAGDRWGEVNNASDRWSGVDDTRICCSGTDNAGTGCGGTDDVSRGYGSSSCSPVFIKVMLLNRAFIINVLSGSHIYNCRARGVFAPLSQGYGPSAITRQ